jgi:SAM-dependent methyltransferase
MMNDKDRILHQEIHKSMMRVSPDNIFTSRVEVFDRVCKKLNLKINGKVADIGCGNGYASIWLAKKMQPEIVYAVEASDAAVDELLPRNIKHHGVENIVVPKSASFEALPFDSELDYVVSFGALHHSGCLLTTLRSISKSLTNGGYLISQEPVMPNFTTNQDYVDKYEILENKFGIEMKNGERNDRFFREAEYIAAAAFAGLDLVLYEDFKPEGLRQVLKRMIRKVLVSMRIIRDNHQHKYQKSLMKKIMVFRKSETTYIPHLWYPLRDESMQK